MDCLNCGAPLRGRQELWCSERCRDRARREGYKELTKPGLTVNPIAAIDDKDLAAELSRRGYALEIARVKEDQRHPVNIARFGSDPIKVGGISCTHFGSRYQQLTAVREFYRLCADREIPLVLHGGDAVDGNGNVYKGQIYEMFCVGFDAQRDYMVENYPREEGVETMMIAGNHDHSYIKDGGADILEAVAREREDITYLGVYGAYLDLGPLSIYLMHSDAGGAYARSYKPQKIIEGFSPEGKPHIVAIGHWHTALYIPAYRNVEGFTLPAFQSQTPYLKRKGIFPNVAAWIWEIYPDKKGLASIKAECLHWHIIREKDY